MVNVLTTTLCSPHGYASIIYMGFIGEDEKVETMSVNLDVVEEWKVDDKTGTEEIQGDPSIGQEEETVYVTESNVYRDAKEKELKSWSDHNVYKEVEDIGQKVVSTRWVCTMKERDGQLVPKARLVARGFEEFGADIERDSPTCSSEALKVVLSIIACMSWKPNSMDVKTAFLQGTKLEREVFIRPPVEVGETGILWKLEKCVYGLGDASLHWYKKVKECMTKLGGKVSKMEPALFIWHDENGDLSGVLTSHVDDFLWAGTEEFEKEVIAGVRKELVIGKEDEDTFRYVGVNIQYKDGQIWLDQNFYKDCLEYIDMSKDRMGQKDDEVNEKERKVMREKIGQLLWLGRQSRPDILFDVTSLATKVKRAKVEDLLDTNKVLKKAKTEKLTLRFSKLENPRVTVFSDASIGNVEQGCTQGGYFICLQGEEKRISPLCWSSRKVRRVVRSSLAGETLAMADAIDMGLSLNSLYAEVMGINVTSGINCITDCKSLFEAVKSNKGVTERRLRMEISGIRESMERKEIEDFKWVEGKQQLADVLTKKGASPHRILTVLENGSLK